MKKKVYWIILILSAYIFLEAFSYSGLLILGKVLSINSEPVNIISDRHRNILSKFVRGEAKYIVYSSTLGWTIKKDGASQLYQANSSGIRANKNHELNPPTNVLRISAFGDSFTHCDGVSNVNTWQAIMETNDTDLEVINFGVSGFGLDQAYLRYLEEGIDYKSHIVLIGFMSENVFRNVNTFRPFLYQRTGIPLTKPRFDINGVDLSLVTNPMSELDDYNMLLTREKDILCEIGINDYFFQNRYGSIVGDFSPTIRLIKIIGNKVLDRFIYSEKSEAFRVTKKIFDEFYLSVINNNSIPIILIFPNKGDIDRYQAQKAKKYSPLLSYLSFKGYQYIDLLDAFENVGKEYGVDDIILGPDIILGHYSPLGNELVAWHILAYLGEKGLRKKGQSVRVE